MTGPIDGDTAESSTDAGHVLLKPLRPGETIPGDWFAGTVPKNIDVADGVRIESSYSFQTFRSQEAIGLRVGKKTILGGAKLGVGERGRIDIGECCFIAEAALMCDERITIGDRVYIAAMVSIADSDFRPLDPTLRAEDCIALAPGGSRIRPFVHTSPVVIEDDVWVAFGATILKGVHIGKGAVVGAGSVVTRSVPPGMLVVGNPARVVGPAEVENDAC